MKKILLFTLVIGINYSCYSQKNTSTTSLEIENYQKMKAEGTIPPNFSFSDLATLFQPKKKKGTKGGINNKSSTAACGCYVTPDTSYTLALAPNDDGSSPSIPIPFTFTLYGTTYTSLYINNNGNVSFGSPYPQYSSTPFPNTNNVMVAPFWGDVDTRTAGTVRYKITPTAIYVNWDSVGYYNQQSDKVNTFQLILTDGISPILPSGNNIAFCYEDMAWTTGAASSGVGGFGGTPATVGVNKGDGISYVQMGQFDQPGAFYDGGFGLTDGVSWLDNQSLYFNVASNANFPPVANFTPTIFNSSGNGTCDTIRLCENSDTLLINGLFLSPEIGETTTVTVNFNGNSGFTLLNNVPGNPATTTVQVVASPLNAGMNVITFTATDNGTPVETTVVDLNIFVDTSGFSAFNPIVSGDLDFCDGLNSTLTVSPTNYTSYIWNTGSIDTTINVDSSGTYWVTSELNGCFKTVTVNVVEHPSVIPVVTGNSTFCAGDSSLLNATAGYNSYLWSTSANDTLDSVYVTNGNYTVFATDSFGCGGLSAPFNVTVIPANITITGDTNYCVGGNATINAGAGYNTYLWSTGDTTQTINVTQGTYYVTVTLNSCTATSDTIAVNLTIVPQPVITGPSSFCTGVAVPLDADSIGTGYNSFSWSTTPTQSNQIANIAAAGSYTVIATLAGCSDTSAPFILSENAIPSPIITGNLFYCANDSNGTTLSTMNSYVSYTWFNGDTTATSVTSTGPTTVTVTDANGCIGTSPAATITSASPVTAINGVIGFCNNQTITINADPGFTSYTWNNGETTESITVGNGTYTVIVTDANGCTDEETVILAGFPLPVANFNISPDNESPSDEPVKFTDASSISSGTIASWLWNFDVNNSSGANPSTEISQGPHTVVYTVQGPVKASLFITSDNGCTNLIEQDYLIVNDIFIPSVFTPNGDNHNDFLVFTSLKYHPGNTLEVFNRWGTKVYEKENYENDWDGGGHAEGTYFYILTVSDLTDPIKGSITILR